MGMTFSEMAVLIGERIEALDNIEFSSVSSDSRNVSQGSLFVALQGERSDGHEFAVQAQDAGAVAILGDRADLKELSGLPYVQVSNPRRAIGLAAHRLAGDPSHDLTVIGVTGTNGKSSTVYLIRQVLESCGRRSAQFGTIEYRIGDEVLDAPHTTPFAEDLAELFRRAKDGGATHVAMEVSSHALEQQRVAGIDFNAAVFTNLTQDHLDYHDGMEGYLREKVKLFECVEGEGKFTVVNREDPYAEAFIEASRVPCHTFGTGGDCTVKNVRFGSRETVFGVESPWGEAEIRMSLLGAHNVSNALAAITTCCALGIPLEDVARGVESLNSVPGRFEHVDAGQNFQVIVDYAHTEDGLRNVLEAAREICERRVIVVFGCGGDRDTGKRPKMAAVAGELADFSIATSDNPRTESPERILLDVEVGLQRTGKKRDEDYLVIEDRAEAIDSALKMAEAGDLVMIAGKGHEDYQILNSGRIHFDDREVARRFLEAR